MYKYDPYTDKFTKISDDGPVSAGTSTTMAAIPVYTYPCVYIAEECIEKIADAVVRKMKGEVNNA